MTTNNTPNHHDSMAGTAAWQCRSASTLGAFHLYTGKEGGAKEALAVWEETLQVKEK